MEEKERKKQKELEEKEKRRKEREEKRKKKEEEVKKKADERAKKAASKGKQPTQKGSKKASSKSVSSARGEDAQTTSGASFPPMSKRRRLQSLDEIDTNECCICFGNYEQDIIEDNGAEWIACACGRWLHVECAETRVIDVNGCELFCPSCVM